MSQHVIDFDRRTAPAGPSGGPASNGGHVTGGQGGAPARNAGASSGSPASSAVPDATIGALDALSLALEEVDRDRAILEGRLETLRRQRASGIAWRDILAGEEPPGTMQVVSRMLASLATASGTLRKELVDTLRGEKVSIPAIARLFGVTHQRVSNLLRRPSE